MKKQRILFCVLDWGLGHASRCIPIIRYLTEQGAEVFIASSGSALQLLKNEFPSLIHLPLPSYNITYSKGPSQAWAMTRQFGKIRRIIREEKNFTEQLVKEYAIDKIISDNRYGCYANNVQSVIITHQTGILMPKGLKLFEPLIHQWIKKQIAHFNECWIPDEEGNENLSGKLSHYYSTPVKTSFIGPLIRFDFEKELPKEYDVLAILSGPEPQRSILEKELLAQFVLFPDKKFVIVAGRVEEVESHSINEHIKYISSAGSAELNKFISASDIIISRSGYSTVMDLHRSNKYVIFIPTPGQTEQEYLAVYLANQDFCFSTQQGKINLRNAIEEVEKTNRFYFVLDVSYKEAINKLLLN